MEDKYFVISELAISQLISSRHVRGSLLPWEGVQGIYEKSIGNNVVAYATGREHVEDYVALVSVGAISSIDGEFDTVYSRIARVLKAASTPPLHLPRSWAEFHYKNRVAFFAVAEDEGAHRWLVDVDGSKKLVRFLAVSDRKKRLLLQDWEPEDTPDVSQYRNWVVEASEIAAEVKEESFAEKVDLKAIGSEAVVQGYLFENWMPKLKEEQRKIVESPSQASMRVVGPAGSGKTLTLCMRAIKLSRDPDTIDGRKKILVVTHSWAMAERIDGVLASLNGGYVPDNISVLPLLYALQYHSGSVSGASASVLGHDSSDGQRKFIELIDRNVDELASKLTANAKAGLSDGVLKALSSAQGVHARNEIVLDFYQEIVGILSPQGIVPDDSDKVSDYINSEREEGLPPFSSRGDREFCLKVYERLLSNLVDQGVITTDQLVLDSVRIFETFTWNVKREVDGYDYLLIDELQLFDAQERLAVSLLSRSKPGMIFLSVEDPAQGLFSAINSKSRVMGASNDVYLEQAHRFRSGLFEFISYLYGKFPLNATAIKVARPDSRKRMPRIVKCETRSSVIAYCKERVSEVVASTEKDRRICIVCVSAVEDEIYRELKSSGEQVVRLSSFDDVEMLTYQRKSAVISSWQFVGGTQFSDVLLVVSGLQRPTNVYSKIKELTAIYLGASRASSALDVVCERRIPDIIQGAINAKLAAQVNYHDK